MLNTYSRLKLRIFQKVESIYFLLICDSCECTDQFTKL